MPDFDRLAVTRGDKPLVGELAGARVACHDGGKCHRLGSAPVMKEDGIVFQVPPSGKPRPLNNKMQSP